MGRKLDNDHTYRLLSAEHLCGGPVETMPVPFLTLSFQARPASRNLGPYSKHPVALRQGQWQDLLQGPIENCVWAPN